MAARMHRSPEMVSITSWPAVSSSSRSSSVSKRFRAAPSSNFTAHLCGSSWRSSSAGLGSSCCYHRSRLALLDLHCYHLFGGGGSGTRLKGIAAAAVVSAQQALGVPGRGAEAANVPQDTGAAHVRGRGGDGVAAAYAISASASSHCSAVQQVKLHLSQRADHLLILEDNLLEDVLRGGIDDLLDHLEDDHAALLRRNQAFLRLLKDGRLLTFAGVFALRSCRRCLLLLLRFCRRRLRRLADILRRERADVEGRRGVTTACLVIISRTVVDGAVVQLVNEGVLLAHQRHVVRGLLLRTRRLRADRRRGDRVVVVTGGVQVVELVGGVAAR
ncbi:hypothetical protein TYRP_005783 [Tyrophagus putrescentiae]|nr:hypothetical protein TYRP_005783 [Tyrophagus putrescentiae]